MEELLVDAAASQSSAQEARFRRCELLRLIFLTAICRLEDALGCRFGDVRKLWKVISLPTLRAPRFFRKDLRRQSLAHYLRRQYQRRLATFVKRGSNVPQHAGNMNTYETYGFDCFD